MYTKADVKDPRTPRREAVSNAWVFSGDSLRCHFEHPLCMIHDTSCQCTGKVDSIILEVGTVTLNNMRTIEISRIHFIASKIERSKKASKRSSTFKLEAWSLLTLIRVRVFVYFRVNPSLFEFLVISYYNSLPSAREGPGPQIRPRLARFSKLNKWYYQTWYSMGIFFFGV